MLRFLFLGFLTIGCLATLNCQSYTTDLQQRSTRADEAAVMAHMQAIARAQSAYSMANGGEYGTFEQLAAGGYLDSRFNTSQPKYYGYILTMKVNPKSGSTDGSYGLNADPDPAGKASGRHLYLGSSSASIYVNATRPATEKDEAMVQ